MADLDAKKFERRLREHQSDEELGKIQRYFKDCAGALSVMDKQARRKRTPPERRRLR